MKLTLPKHWVAKLLSLALAIAIWFLIKDYLNGDPIDTSNAPRALPVVP